jgi:uncharacterized membrane protein (DUF4010 family)
MAANDIAAVYAFLTSLGLGLVMGLERERRPDTKAGLRTFGLVAVLGTVCALLAERAASPLLLPAVILALALTMIAADRDSAAAPAAPDTTTTVAMLLCFGYGAMLWYGYTRLAVALGLTTTTLLYFKTELHEVSRHLSRQDMVSFLQFAVISFIVLPLLPDRGYGPYGALNPYQIWLMVVLILGIGLAGYMSLRLVGRRAPPLLGILGGLISSTATTLVFARKARAEHGQTESAVLIILIANLVLLLRIGVVVAVVAPAALRSLAPVLALGLLAGVIVPLRLWRRSAGPQTANGLLMKNPLEMTSALSFGLVYAFALVLTAWLHDEAGARGIYFAAPALGLTDMDAITLSALKLFSGGQLNAVQVSTTLVLALGANLLFKAAIAQVLGGRPLGWRVTLGFLPVLGGLLLGLALAR